MIFSLQVIGFRSWKMKTFCSKKTQNEPFSSYRGSLPSVSVPCAISGSLPSALPPSRCLETLSDTEWRTLALKISAVRHSSGLFSLRNSAVTRTLGVRRIVLHFLGDACFIYYQPRGRVEHNRFTSCRYFFFYARERMEKFMRFIVF